MWPPQNETRTSEIKAAGFFHDVLGAVRGGKVRTESQSERFLSVEDQRKNQKADYNHSDTFPYPTHTSQCFSPWPRAGTAWEVLKYADAFAPPQRL